MQGFPVSHQLLEFTQTHVYWVGNAIQLSHPLSSLSPPALNVSQHQGVSSSIRWPKYWSFSFSNSPSDEYSGLTSFRKDWLDLSETGWTVPSMCSCSTPGLPVHHKLSEFTQTHVHWVGGAIQPSHPLSSLSPPALKSFPASGSFQMSQFFTSGGRSIGISALASVLPMNTQGWSPLGCTGWISLQSKGLSRVFNTTVQKH